MEKNESSRNEKGSEGRVRRRRHPVVGVRPTIDPPDDVVAEAIDLQDDVVAELLAPTLDVLEAAQKVAGMLPDRPEDRPDNLLVVRELPRRVRVGPRPTGRKGDPARGETEALETSHRRWKDHRKFVAGIEAEANNDPEAAFRRAMQRVLEEVSDARREMDLRFGVLVDVEDVPGAPRRVEVVARVELSDPGYATALGDAWWRLVTYNDARVYASSAIVKAQRRGCSEKEVARSACEALVHVLRTRPLLWGVLVAPPHFGGWTARGLEGARGSFAHTLAGWVRSHLSFSMLGVTAKEGLRELSGLTVDEWDKLVELAGKNPDEVRGKYLKLRDNVSARIKKEQHKRSRFADSKTKPEDHSAEGQEDEMQRWADNENSLLDIVQLNAWVKKAKLEALSESEARALELDLKYDLDTAAVAREMDVKPATVRRFRVRYRRKLKAIAGL